ncbi:uncharacterized protein LOC110975947 [Acanthaster planci]|uniref:Uncharacterized protein LOC110975947 n=1 Tax=Acanthaster planci TaxID=133434 RepID=A0A8B7XUK6_ACAPL|nr:uncharacterized protein LOC110975947 [Acanthaster planci]
MNLSLSFWSSVRFLWILTFVLTVIVTLGQGAEAAKRPKGNNVCTRIKSVTEVYRIPFPGTKTKTIRYTTLCGIQGRCSRYRLVYVHNYREETRTIYRVVQECCTGWVQRGRKCMTAPAPVTTAGTLTTTTPATTLGSGTKNEPTGGPTKTLVYRPNGITDRSVTKQEVGIVGVGKVNTESRNRVGFEISPTEREQDRERARSKNGNGDGPGREGIHGRTEIDGTSNTKIDESSLQDSFPIDEGVDPATPDMQPPQKDSGMMFLTGMLCGVGVLSLAAVVILFLMYRQRRSMDSRLTGLTFLQSTRTSSCSFRKSKLLALAQSIKAGEVKIIRESTKKGKASDHSPYADIEEMQRGIKYDNLTKSLPTISSKLTEKESPTLKPSKTMTQGKSSSSKLPLQNERQLPPEPPTYAIIQRVATKKKAQEAPWCENEPHSSSESRYSTMYATPDAALKGNSRTIPREFNMGPPRYILCESQHIYADIQRKSKASTWSFSKKSRPKSTVSAGERPRQSSRKRSRSLSRNSLQSIVKRGSNAGSSGYSSLRGSRENIFECAEERSGLPNPNIYSETIPKDMGTTEHYDRLDLITSDSLTEYDKLDRGLKTPRGAGLVKTFSKKYEKLAMSVNKR